MAKKKKQNTAGVYNQGTKHIHHLHKFPCIPLYFCFFVVCFGFIFFLMFSEVLLLLFVMRIHLRSTLLKKILSVWYRMAYYRHYVPVRSFQSCPALCDPMDCSLVGFSVHGILQAKMLEWTAAPSSQGSSWPRDWVHVACIAGRFFSTELGKPSRHCFVQ